MKYGQRGEFGSATKHITFAIRRTVLVPGVCLCICNQATMHHVHAGEAMMTSDKFDISLAVYAVNVWKV